MKYLSAAVLLLLSARAFAQQDPLNAQYLSTPLIINPAYTGLSRDLNLALNYRRQWIGFEGNPQTANLSGHVALRNNKMGVGMIVLQDKIGSNNFTDVELTYGYHVPIAGDIKLSFGLQAGYINFKSDYSKLIIDPNDPQFNSTSIWQPNFGAGIILTSTKYMVAVSAPKMLKVSAENPGSGLYNRSFYALGAYVIPLSERIRIRPYILYRSSDHSKSSYDLGANLLDVESYSVGAFTRNLSTYGFTGQINIGDRMRVGYAFELPTNQSAGVNYTTHELLISFRLRAFQFHDIESIRSF